MQKKKECVAMLLAGGEGSRLQPLTRSLAKPAVPFGGKYRIVDFTLSNCANSGIDTVGVLTQYQPLVLSEYVGDGRAWDLDRSLGGVRILPPYKARRGGDWYRGTANAVWQNREFIARYAPRFVLVLSGDHIYRMNYRALIAHHIAHHADASIAVIDVPLEEASRFGILSADEEGRMTAFEEKPKNPKSTLASMGIYLFNTAYLMQYLEKDAADPTSKNDFGKNVIPAMLADGGRIFVYRHTGYWRDVGTLESLW
jgi:glucose-1-phosphate adenylyltransferase